MQDRDLAMLLHSDCNMYNSTPTSTQKGEKCTIVNVRCMDVELPRPYYGAPSIVEACFPVWRTSRVPSADPVLQASPQTLTPLAMFNDIGCRSVLRPKLIGYT